MYGMISQDHEVLPRLVSIEGDILFVHQAELIRIPDVSKIELTVTTLFCIISHRAGYSPTRFALEQWFRWLGLYLDGA